MGKAITSNIPNTLKLFSDYERNNYHIKAHLEQDYAFYDRVKNDNYAKIRNILEEWFVFYSEQHKFKMIADFKVKFYHAFFELVVFTFLRKSKLNPQVEAKAVHSGLTPDFFCENNATIFFVECTVCEGISENEVNLEKRKKTLYHNLAELDIPDYFINIDHLELKSNKQFRIKKIIDLIQSKVNAFTEEEIILIQNCNNQHPNFPRLHYEDNDVSVSFYFLYRTVKSIYDSQNPIGFYPVSSEWLGIENAIPKSIEKKMNKYSKISEQYFVFINYTESAYYRKDDLNWHLYGGNHWKGEANVKPLFHSSKAHNLLGVVVTNLFPVNLHRFTIDLYINPSFDVMNPIFDFIIEDRDEDKYVYQNIDIHNILNVESDFIDDNIWSI